MLVEIGSAFFGRSAAMRLALELAHGLAPLPLPILLLGPSGSGKGLLARLIHRLSRPKGTWRCVTGGELRTTLWYGRLFGHEKGSFTGAEARQKSEFELTADGTLFLDELHEWPRDVQSGLLRALQDGVFTPHGSPRAIPITSRLLFATTKDPRILVNAGDLIPDIEHRLPALVITLPSLAERRTDLLPLASVLRDRLAQRLRIERVPRFSPDAVRALLGHPWPGNVRELERALERGLAMAMMREAGSITADLLGLQPPDPDCLDRILARETFDSVYQWALDEAQGNRTLAGAMIGRHRHTVRRWVAARNGSGACTTEAIAAGQDLHTPPFPTS